MHGINDSLDNVKTILIFDYKVNSLSLGPIY